MAWDGEEPVFAADAIADPLTGLLAALVAAALVTTASSGIVELSLAEVAAYCAAGPRYTDTRLTIEPPRVAARSASPVSAPLWHARPTASDT